MPAPASHNGSCCAWQGGNVSIAAARIVAARLWTIAFIVNTSVAWSVDARGVCRTVMPPCALAVWNDPARRRFEGMINRRSADAPLRQSIQYKVEETIASSSRGCFMIRAKLDFIVRHEVA